MVSYLLQNVDLFMSKLPILEKRIGPKNLNYIILKKSRKKEVKNSSQVQ